MLYLLAMLLAILSSIFYHLIARSIPTGVHPLVTLTITYLSAAVLCMALLPFFPAQESVRASLARVNWTSVGLAFAITGIELGFLLAYRAGWNISLATLVANASATVALVAVGVLALKERLSLTQMVGMAACVVGLVLINRK